MVSIVKEMRGNSIVAKLSGTIEENINFKNLLGDVSGSLIVNTKEVFRINSDGVRAWIQYFQSLQSKGVKITYEDCSVAIVEQINMVANFRCGGTVQSIIVPHLCLKCSTHTDDSYTVDQLKSLDFKVSPLKCPKCGGWAELDEIPEEYFSFLTATLDGICLLYTSPSPRD